MPKAPTAAALAENCRIFRDFLEVLAAAGHLPEDTESLGKYLGAVAQVPNVAALLAERLTPQGEGVKGWPK